METHKPKPWRGPGEFFREYLIIVVGVLTALAGEQVVEWLHRQSELAETREALREEIAQNGGIVTFGVATDRCLLAVLQKYADWAGGGPRPERHASSAFPALNFRVWEVARSGPLSRMPVKERLSYSLVYDRFEKVQKNIDHQIDVGIALLQYTYLEQLNPDQAQRLLELSGAEGALTAVKNGGVSLLLNEVQSLGISPAPLSESQRQALNELCQAAGVPVPAL